MNLSQSLLPNLWEAIRHHYEAGSWSSVMLDAINALGEVLRAKSGLQSDGTVLVGQALGGSDPKIKLNRLQTESDRNVQTGTENIARGLFQAIRNPRSHGRVEDSEADAVAIVLMVNYLLIQLGQAKAAFTIEGIIETLRDRNFVPSERYAALILASVPKAKLSDTVVNAFLQRPMDSQPLRAFFSVALALMEQADREHFFEVVTGVLQQTTEESELRTALQALGPAHWLSIGEAARLRCEHWIIKNAGSGAMIPGTARFAAGQLATWSKGYLSKFTLKDEFADQIISNASSLEAGKREYALRNFVGKLDLLLDAPPPRLVKALERRLQLGDMLARTAVIDLINLHEGDAWSRLESILTKFKPSQDDFADDDIPF